MSVFKKSWLISYILFISYGCFAQKRYYILFTARAPRLSPTSFGGHAFVTWHVEDTFQTIEQFTYGFYPSKGKGLLFNTQGRVAAGYEYNRKTVREIYKILIEVDSSDYVATLQEADQWQNSSYNLWNRNCVHFIHNIAVAARMTVPDLEQRSFPILPNRYIQKLTQLNQAHLVHKKELWYVRERILYTAQIDDEMDIE